MSDEQKRVFAHNLNKFIEAKGVLQKDVAYAIGVSPQSLNSWTQGIAIPRMPSIQKLADYFGIEMSDLIEEKKVGYYYNEETARIAQEVYENPDLRLVFEACRNTTPEQLQQFIRLAKALRGDV